MLDMAITPDSLALLLLCSNLGLASNSEVSPLTLKEWNPLARKLQALSRRPADLLGFKAGDFQSLELETGLTDRLTLLIDRQSALTTALARLENLQIHALTRADREYPEKYRQRLKESAPAVLFYAGEPALLGQPGVAVVGSRQLDQVGQECARFVGNACGLSGLVLYSGGAKGVDTISMEAALESRGSAVGVLASGFEKAVRDIARSAAFQNGDLCLATPYSPNAGFSVGAAMGRNRLIYCLADYAIVVASDAETGGTWAGAMETLKKGWVPVYVLEHPQMPDGNRLLLQKGGLSFPHPFPLHHSKLLEWLGAQAVKPKPKPSQPQLF
jgi:predicted Rossmann fold nucleotide-binding protein DprA/Smf involved in DNA uptake